MFVTMGVKQVSFLGDLPSFYREGAEALEKLALMGNVPVKCIHYEFCLYSPDGISVSSSNGGEWATSRANYLLPRR